MAKNKYQKNVVLTSISVIAFLALILSAAWATMSINATHGNVNVNTTIASRPVFTATPSGVISLSVDSIGQTVSEGYVAASDTTTLDILLSSNWSNSVTCTYDIVWEWNETLNVGDQYAITSSVDKEYTISGMDTSNNEIDEVQLQDYTDGIKQVLGSSSITVATNSMATDTWTFEGKFYKDRVSQSNHKGHNYAGTIHIENVLCSSDSLPSEYQEVEYIKSDGSAYIDIDYTYQINDEIDCEFSKDESTSGIQGIFGNGNASPYYGTVLYINASNILTVTIGGKLGQEYFQWKNNPIVLGQNYSASIKGNKLYINGEEVVQVTNTLTNGTQSDFSLFRRWNTLGLHGKIYRMSIKRQNQYLYDFVPCYRKSDSVIGMYDKVHNTFYPNAGSGTFTKGSNV